MHVWLLTALTPPPLKHPFDLSTLFECLLPLAGHCLLYIHDCVLCAALFDKGIRPHKYCLPILKREEHRLALLGAISSGSSKFFLGTDSAPHDKSYVVDSTPAIGCKIMPVLHCTALHCTVLHCTALRCTALCCICRWLLEGDPRYCEVLWAVRSQPLLSQPLLSQPLLSMHWWVAFNGVFRHVSRRMSPQPIYHTCLIHSTTPYNPHARFRSLCRRKESACGCAGIYSAHAALGLYAEAFEEAGALDKLEAFVSENGADFYGLPRNETEVLLKREPWIVPDSYPLGEDGKNINCTDTRTRSTVILLNNA